MNIGTLTLRIEFTGFTVWMSTPTVFRTVRRKHIMTQSIMQWGTGRREVTRSLTYSVYPTITLMSLKGESSTSPCSAPGYFSASRMPATAPMERPQRYTLLILK